MLRQKFILFVSILIPLVVYGDSRLETSHRLLAQADRLAMLYNWPEAAPLYEQSKALFEKSGDKANAIAARFGYLWTTADSGVSQAVVHEVGTYLQDPIVQASPKLLLRGLVTQAVLDRNTNEVAAREPWEKILDLAKILGDKGWEARAKAEIGQILYLDGDVQSATRMIREALLSQYARLDFGAAIHYTAMVGNGFVEAGRPETGLQYCNIALKTQFFVKDIGFPFLAYQGKARALIALNRDAEATAVLNEAIQRAREEQNYLALTQLLIVSDTAAGSSHAVKAGEHLKEAAEVSQAKGFNHVFAWSSFELARIYRDNGNLDAAELQASRAIQEMRSLEDRYHLPAHLALLADVEAKKGEFTRADQLYSEATDVIDGLLVNVNTRQLKSSLIATLSEAYVGHFELVATKFANPAKAYEIIEKARGRSLADTLRGESETMSAEDEVSIDAQKNINRIQTALLHEADSERRQVLFEELFAAEQLLSRDRNTRSNLGSPTQSRRPVPLATLQASLRSDEILLEYVLSEPESYCLQISRARATVAAVPAGRKQIEDLVERYLTTIRARRLETGFSNELFALLLQPVIQEGSENSLIIVPDGKLNLLPFDALKDQQGKYVLDSHVVTYAPSATVLHLLRQSRSSDHAKMNFLGVGDVVYSGPVASTRLTDDGHGSKKNTVPDFSDLQRGTLPPLPGTREEVTEIAAIIQGPNQMLLENNATEAAFKELPLADFRIIHLAVHGVADTGFPDRAALVLGSSPTSQEDGLLQAREIRDLPLSADLVTLSACDTGTGKLLGQDGIASLERAFLLAGAKAVIASLWTADDVYTIALMKRLYQHLVEGYEKGGALRQAKVDLLNEFGERALPVYWAGFTLVGDGSGTVFK